MSNIVKHQMIAKHPGCTRFYPPAPRAAYRRDQARPLNRIREMHIVDETGKRIAGFGTHVSRELTGDRSGRSVEATFRA
jgi:hypothetical protein